MTIAALRVPTAFASSQQRLSPWVPLIHVSCHAGACLSTAVARDVAGTSSYGRHAEATQGLRGHQLDTDRSTSRYWAIPAAVARNRLPGMMIPSAKRLTGGRKAVWFSGNRTVATPPALLSGLTAVSKSAKRHVGFKKSPRSSPCYPQAGGTKVSRWSWTCVRPWPTAGSPSAVLRPPFLAEDKGGVLPALVVIERWSGRGALTADKQRLPGGLAA
jgi:hypothetical protein